MIFGDQTVLCIGTWRVDPATDEISRGAETHKLEPRTMRLLLYLAARPGQVVDLDRLLNEVWSGVVVTPGSVYQAIAQLRHLLGDRAEQPTYIETHARKGYRLVASVSPWVDPHSDSQSFNGAHSALPRAGDVTKAVSGRSRHRLLAAALLSALVGAAALAWFLRTAPRPAPLQFASTTFAPPPHSIAVLPFVNISGDKEQEYFSDGLTEELLNSLSRINGLQVAARTSSFYFKGKDVDLGTVARKLNVAAVLEGSVRKSANTVRVTAQLANAANGYHLWSQTYDRNLGEVLALQAEIADAVTSALKITLLGGVAEKVELGATHNPLAFDAYLRGLRLTRLATNEREARLPLDEYAEAIRLDPNYALAYAARSLAASDYLYQWGVRLSERHDAPQKARVDAERAIALAPGLGLAHAALARFLEASALDYARASEESERALALAPGNATVLYEYSQHAAYMGRSNAAIDTARKGVTLDPLNPLSHRALGDAFWFARHYDEAIGAYQDAIAVDTASAEAYSRCGLVYYAMGNYQAAQSTCKLKPEHWESWLCLALSYQRLRMHRESEEQIRKLEDFASDAGAYQYAQIYAQRGDRRRALEWLDTAWRLRDPGFRRLKTDPLMDPLREEQRFQAIERALKFPD